MILLLNETECGDLKPEGKRKKIPNFATPAAVFWVLPIVLSFVICNIIIIQADKIL